MTFSLLSAAAIFLVGAITGLLTGIWWCAGEVMRAQTVYRQAKAVAVVAEVALATLMAELDSGKETGPK